MVVNAHESDLGCGEQGAPVPQRDEDGEAEGDGAREFERRDAARCLNLSKEDRLRDRTTRGDYRSGGDGRGEIQDAATLEAKACPNLPMGGVRSKIFGPSAESPLGLCSRETQLPTVSECGSVTSTVSELGLEDGDSTIAPSI